ncbi:MAG: Ig-like domain-containing protein [Candidatus Eisenbacteria bacterium]
MRVFVVSAMVILSLAVAGVAAAGIPNASTSTVEREGQGSPGTCDPDIAIVCPASDIGAIQVTVTVRNIYGDPLPGMTVDCWAEEVAGVFCWCPGESLQTDVTDINGQCFFYFTDFGGCGTIQFGAQSDGIVFTPSPTIEVRSPDINGDCIVNLQDFILFAGYYLTTNPCGDFDCSGLVDLQDFIIFASHYLHVCP